MIEDASKMKDKMRKSAKYLLFLLILMGAAWYFYFAQAPKKIDPVVPEKEKVTADIKTPAEESITAVDTKIKLNAPSELMVTDGDSAKITLYWKPSPHAAYYSVFRLDAKDSSYHRIADNIAKTYFVDKNIQSNRLYSYKVKAGKDGYLSPFSKPEKGYAKQEKIANLQASNGSYANHIRLTWADAKAQDFVIYRAAKPAGTYTAIAKVKNKDVYDDHNVSLCKEYYYKVSAEQEGKESIKSSWASGYSQCLGLVTSYAGNGTIGNENSTQLKDASFHRPVGIVMRFGTLYIADSFNHQIRSINPNGTIQTLFSRDAKASTFQHAVDRASYRPTGIAVDSLGNVFISEVDNHIIRKITPNGKAMIFAGNGKAGFKDARGTKARFNKPYQIFIDKEDTLYVTEIGNHRIRKITKDASVTTFAGNGTGGKRDGSLLYARFDAPMGITQDSLGNFFVTDGNNNNIRIITKKGEVRTFAGSGKAEYQDGVGIGSSFNNPRGIAIDKDDILYLADTGNHKIRIITPKARVKTLVGISQSGDTNGFGSDTKFFSPRGITISKSSVLYVTDFHVHKVKRILLKK